MNNIILQIIDSKEYDKNDDNKVYTIDLYGKTSNDKSILLVIENFKPYFYIDKCDMLMISDVLKNKFYEIYKTTLGKYYKFEKDGLDNLCDILKIEFNSLSGMYKTKGTLKKRNVKTYESNIQPLLRFFHIQKIYPSCWITIDNPIKLSCSTSCNLCYKCDYLNVKYYNCDIFANFKILSFDCETYSSTGKFPVPTIINDVLFMIGNVITYLNTNEVEKYLFVYGNCSNILNVNVICCKSEEELISKWILFIREKDPDIVIGYNIFGFDELYIYERAKILGITNIFENIGRNLTLETSFLEKKAKGNNIYKLFDMIGRFHLDLLVVMRKEYNLQSYKLDFVSEEFLSSSIKKIITDKDDIILECDNIDDVIINNFIVIKEDFYKYQNGKKFLVKSINKTNKQLIIQNTTKRTTGNGITNLIFDIEKKYKYSIVKDDITPNQMFFDYKSKDSSKIANIGKYCIQDCQLVIKLLTKLNILFTYIPMANISLVPLNYILLRGQGIKVLSLISNECYNKNYIIPTLIIDNNEINKEVKFEGALVFEPKINFYNDPITVTDFNSLYPSSMIELNISRETIFDKSTFEKVIKDKKFKKEDFKLIEFDSKDKSKKYQCYYNISKKGIIPIVLEKLLQTRKDVKKLMEKEKDPLKIMILNGQQLAYKITANSVYGSCGAKTSAIYLEELASSTTARGRFMLEKAKCFIENTFVQLDNVKEFCLKNNIIINPIVIYGDTDSNFTNFQINRNNETLSPKQKLEFSISLGKLFEENFLKVLDKPQKMVYEKTFYPFLLTSKKKYIGMKYENDSSKCKLYITGIELMKKDCPIVVKKCLNNIVSQLMKGNITFSNINNIIVKNLTDIYDGKYDINDFILSKKLGANYKNQNVPHFKLSQQITKRDPGNAPLPNDIIEYIIYKKFNKCNVGDKIETPKYIIDNNLKIDYDHYIYNILYKPLLGLISYMPENEIKKINLNIKNLTEKYKYKNLGIAFYDW